MARKLRPGTRAVSGILLVDKPGGETSNRTLQRVKRLFAAHKAGHTGTLDPMATGMLPVCFGSATRVSGLMLEASKVYRVTARFGEATDTGDASGQIIGQIARDEPSSGELEAALAGMRGSIRQVPPMYSALKHEGRRLYELARKGEEVPRKARSVTIHEFVLESGAWPELSFRVHCSKGTYIRSLIVDLAATLAAAAHVSALRRLAVGPFREGQMIDLEEIEALAAQGTDALDGRLLGIDAALMDRPAIVVTDAEAGALGQGQRVQVAPGHTGSVRVYAAGGRFVGLGELDSAGALKPARIFLN